MSNINRGDILQIDLDPTIGSEQSGRRPAVVIQAFVNSSIILIAPITTKRKGVMRTHVPLKGVDGLDDNSVALLEQMRSVDKARIHKHIGAISEDVLDQIVDVYEMMAMPNFEKKEIMQMTLCYQCSTSFRNSGCHLRRNHNKKIKDTCAYCTVRQGWDYLIER